MDVTVTTTPLLDCAGLSLGEHLDVLGELPPLRRAELIEAVASAGLTGRGGAGFPVSRKLAAVAQGSRPIVVANAAEGEPASGKDRYLLSQSPHLVLDGVQVAAVTVGARRAYVYGPRDLLEDCVLPAMEERKDRVKVTPFAAENAFLSGEESALVSAINGTLALPTTTPPRVFTQGVRGRPTLVQNVETLANLALIARFGPAWFRERGTTDEPGSRLVTVSGGVAHPGVLEVDGGARIESIVDDAGGLTGPASAVLIGGFHGGWVPWMDVHAGLRLTRSDLCPHDASPGAGVLVVLPRSACGLRYSAQVLQYLAGQNAGQCGPCVNGLPALADTMTRLARGRASTQMESDIEWLCRITETRGACHHPTGTVRLARSTMRTFRDEVRRHREGLCTERPRDGGAR